jgi:L-ascorbate metabolism protein UlaG (beta-lactamase superfamily)
MGHLYRLSPSTFIEPLVNRWAAWPTLIAPVPASLHLIRYQLPLLRSFVANPELHEEASRSPALVCGPFAALPRTRVIKVQELLASTERAMDVHVRVAGEFDAFQRRLVAEANGLSLQRFYDGVPVALKGCVELTYDYQNRPSVRVIEPLVYRTALYDKSLQSVHLAALRDDRSRPYFLNTPRLSDEQRISWTVPFADPRLDELYRLDVAPRREGEIRELLQVNVSTSLDMVLSDHERVMTRPTWHEPRTRVRYFGHACVLVERGGQSVLVDPFISPLPTHKGSTARLSYADLPSTLDYALITHGHQDHLCLETLLRLRHRIACVVVPRSTGALYGDVSLKLMLEQIGFRNVVELGAFDELPLIDGRIIAVPFFGEHSDIGHSKNGYVVRAGCRQIFFAADSDCLDPVLYRRIREHLGVLDTVFVGMESEGAIMSFAYGSLLLDKPSREQEESRRQRGCNAARALRLCAEVGAGEIYNYAMGIEPWLYHVLGLNVGEGSPQWAESEVMLQTLREHQIAGSRLSGCTEFILDELPPDPSLSAAAG